jgi:hypothetical protein
MCLASHFDIIENWKLIFGHREIYYAKKILNTFVCMDIRILVEKWNVYEGQIFPRPLLQICRSEDLTINKKSVTPLVFTFKLSIFFRILRSWKALFNIVSFHPTWFVLKSFRWLEVSNRERNWNKVKNNIYVSSKLQLCQLEIPIFLNNLMCQSPLLITVSFVFLEFNRVASRNEGKTIILVWSSFRIPIY